jgi:hypothetical protein
MAGVGRRIGKGFGTALGAAAMCGLLAWSAAPAGALTLGGPAHPQPGAGSAPTSYQPAVHSAAYANSGVLAYGDAGLFGGTKMSVPSPVVGMATTRDGKGYWIATADGTVYNFGDAPNYGDLSKILLTAPVVGITATADGRGYWMYALDGGIFSFGDAGFYGSTGAIRLNQPIVGMAASPNGRGYWMVASDGGVFSFGAVGFYGSTGSIRLASPVVGMVTSRDGGGYMLAAGDGGVFTFGDSVYRGSMGATGVSGWVDSIAATPDRGGYWLANANGAVYRFGDAQYYGNDLGGARTPPIAQIVPTPTGAGYWLLEPDAYPTTFSRPASGSSIVTLAASQVAGDPETGYFCNPYGPCEAWCALFVTWVWGHEGVPIPSYPFVGTIYDWAAAHSAVLAPWARPSPGDAVLYGTGPQNVDTAVHTGIVAQVWPDGAIDTVEGDAGPAPTGALNVVINGPFLPSHSATYNGFPIFGYAVP